MSRTIRILRWSALTAGGCLGFLALVLAGFYAWAQSDAGRNWIARSLEDALSVPGELTLHIGALEGRLPGAPRLTALTVDDSRGTWLTVQSIAADWEPLELLSGRLRITEPLLEPWRVLLLSASSSGSARGVGRPKKHTACH